MSLKRVLCSIWGHVWEAMIAFDEDDELIIAERCSKCQKWKV